MAVITKPRLQMNPHKPTTPQCRKSERMEQTENLTKFYTGIKAPSRSRSNPYTRFYIPLLTEKVIIVHFITAIFKSQNSAYFSTKLTLIYSQPAEKLT